MSYTLLYHPQVAQEDLPEIPANHRRRIAQALELRLTTAPEKYGEPLKGTLKGYWKLRGGDYRVVYRIAGGEVWILGVLHRRRIYEEIRQRVGRQPG